MSLLEETARDAEAQGRAAERRAAEAETEAEELRDRCLAAEADAEARGCRLEELREALREAREGEAAARQQREAEERAEAAEARQQSMLERLVMAEAAAEDLWMASKDAALQASEALEEAAEQRGRSYSSTPRPPPPTAAAAAAATPTAAAAVAAPSLYYTPRSRVKRQPGWSSSPEAVAEAWGAAEVAREALQEVLQALGPAVSVTGTRQGSVALAVVQVRRSSFLNPSPLPLQSTPQAPLVQGGCCCSSSPIV